MNQAILTGRLTKDPEMKRTQSGTAVTLFTVAVDQYKGNALFIDCVAWRETAEFVSKYFTKGQMIAVVGRIQIREWEDKDKNKRRSYEVVADRVEFCGGKTEKKSWAEEFEDLYDDDGELPF